MKPRSSDELSWSDEPQIMNWDFTSVKSKYDYFKVVTKDFPVDEVTDTAWDDLFTRLYWRTSPIHISIEGGVFLENMPRYARKMKRIFSNNGSVQVMYCE